MVKLRSKLDGYEENQKDRFRWKIYSISFWIIYGIVGSLISYFRLDIRNYIFAVGYLGVFASFLLYSKNFPPEKYEIVIFACFSKASYFVELSLQEKGKIAGRHRKKSANLIETALRKMDQLMNNIRKSEILEKTMYHRLSTLNTNIEKLVLPRVVLGEGLHELKSTLNGLAKFFGGQWESLGINHLDEINKNLETLDPPSEEVRTFMSTLNDFSRRKPVIIGLSIVIGFGITILMIAGFCIMRSIDFMEWIEVNLYGFMLAGIGFSTFISSVLIRK